MNIIQGALAAFLLSNSVEAGNEKTIRGKIETEQQVLHYPLLEADNEKKIRGKTLTEPQVFDYPLPGADYTTFDDAAHLEEDTAFGLLKDGAMSMPDNPPPSAPKADCATICKKGEMGCALLWTGGNGMCDTREGQIPEQCIAHGKNEGVTTAWCKGKTPEVDCGAICKKGEMGCALLWTNGGSMCDAREGQIPENCIAHGKRDKWVTTAWCKGKSGPAKSSLLTTE